MITVDGGLFKVVALHGCEDDNFYCYTVLKFIFVQVSDISTLWIFWKPMIRYGYVSTFPSKNMYQNIRYAAQEDIKYTNRQLELWQSLNC